MSDIKLWHEPSDLDTAYRLAEAIHQGGLAPAHFKNSQSVFSAMAMGSELGIQPMASLRAINVIKGKAGLGADAMVAAVYSRGNVGQWTYEEMSDDCVKLTAQRGTGAPLTLDWTPARAKKAGLGGDAWAKYTRQMLKHRVDAEMCRALWPDIVLGIYTPDELREQPIAAETAPVAVDLAKLPDISQPKAIEAEPILESAEPLEGIPGIGKSVANSMYARGIDTHEQLWEGFKASSLPRNIPKKASDFLRAKFEPAQEPEEDTHIADLAERIEAGREQGMAPVDYIMAQLVEDGIAPDADAALDLFTGTLKALDLSYDECSCEQLAVVWDKASS
jgi:hypothetical protein